MISIEDKNLKFQYDGDDSYLYGLWPWRHEELTEILNNFGIPIRHKWVGLEIEEDTFFGEIPERYFRGSRIYLITKDEYHLIKLSSEYKSDISIELFHRDTDYK